MSRRPDSHSAKATMMTSGSGHAPGAVDWAWSLRGRICDLPGYLLDECVTRASDAGQFPPEVLRAQRQIMAPASQDCRRDEHGCCARADCRCGCHADQEYVPVRGWLPVAQAREDRRQYLDEDAAIERAHDHERDM